MSNKNTKKRTQKLAILGLFSAIIVVLQLLSYGLTALGVFPLSLVLIPIVLGAYLYGAGAGAILGGVFGIVVTLCCFFGLDKGGYILVSANPFITTMICIIKGVLAGFVSGLVSKPLKNKNSLLSAILGAAAAPIVNTGVFILCLSLFFKEILISWAGGTDLVFYIFTGLVGINFLVEFVVNLIASPIILRIQKALKRI